MTLLPVGPTTRIRETGMRFGRQSEGTIIPVARLCGTSLPPWLTSADLLAHPLAVGKEPVLQPRQLLLSPGSDMWAVPRRVGCASLVGHPHWHGQMW